VILNRIFVAASLLACALALTSGAALAAAGDSASAGSKATEGGTFADYPLNPQDEGLQIAANSIAYLFCTCLFIEEKSEAQCVSDLPGVVASIPRTIDSDRRIVTTTAGRWTAVAREGTPHRGCSFVN